MRIVSTRFRKEIFDDNFSRQCSAITALTNSDAKIEFQCYAVIGDKLDATALKFLPRITSVDPSGGHPNRPTHDCL